MSNVKIAHKDNTKQCVVYADSSLPSVVRVIGEGNKVCSVTSLGDEMFVARAWSQIEVYDAKTFELRRPIALCELNDFHLGLVVCPHNNCLYVSDWGNASVHRIDLSSRSRDTVKKWSVAYRPYSLSVNSDNNLIVVSEGEPISYLSYLSISKLQIFTTDGALLQVILLHAGIKTPSHAVQLPTGEFLISHVGSLNCLFSGS